MHLLAASSSYTPFPKHAADRETAGCVTALIGIRNEMSLWAWREDRMLASISLSKECALRAYQFHSGPRRREDSVAIGDVIAHGETDIQSD